VTEAAIRAPAGAADRETFAARLRGFGPAGIVAFLAIFAAALVFMPAAAVLILLWAWASRAWRDLGFTRPKNWVGAVVIGLVLGVGLKLAMKALVMPQFGAPPVNAVYHDLVGNTPAALKYAVYVIFGAGFAEELFFRGYLFERSARLFGKGVIATALTLLAVTALFGIAHWAQGPAGMINAGITGFVAGLIFLYTGRNLWIPVVMHAAFDLTAGAIIYLNLETDVAHLVFK
jgi:membrane protease YdiL (CAAX protease family)